MSKKNIFFLIIILILSFLLRIWCIDKPQGLWNDEYVSWFIASKHFPDEIFFEIIKGCHMPLYFIFLKVWMFFFSDADLSLRLSSVFMGMLSVITMFFVGKRYKGTKLGLLCALAAGVSGFLIYFSQEVRIYSLLFFLASLNLLTFVNLARKQTVSNFIFWWMTNFFILTTHTVGFVFVFFNFLFLAIYVRKINKIFFKYFIGFFIFQMALVIPFLPFVAKVLTSSYSSQFWSDFSLGKIFFVITDYFSPIQINIITTPKSIFDVLVKNSELNYAYFTFAIVPTLLGLIGVINSLFQKQRINKYLASIAFSFFAALILGAILGKLVLATKYSVEIYPILILLMCIGFISFENKFVKRSVIFFFVFLSLTHLVLNKNSAPKLGRLEGNKLVANLITGFELKKSDTIVLTYYSPERFFKYLPIDEYKNLHYIDKYNFPEFFLPNLPSYKDVMSDGKNIFYDLFNDNDTRYFDKQFYNSYIEPLKKGDKLAIVLLKNVCFIDSNKMVEVTSNVSEYENMPLMFLAFSYIKNNSIALATKFLKPIGILEAGDWVMVVFEKM